MKFNVQQCFQDFCTRLHALLPFSSIKSSSHIINEARLDICHKKSEKSRPTPKPTRKGINLT